MNLSNVSALSISIPLENVEEKIKEIQSLNFYIYSIEPTTDDKIRIAASLIIEGDRKQKFDEVDLEELKQKIRVFKNSKKNPYVW